MIRDLINRRLVAAAYALHGEAILNKGRRHGRVDYTTHGCAAGDGDSCVAQHNAGSLTGKSTARDGINIEGPRNNPAIAIACAFNREREIGICSI